jgi:hypothetical protein
MPNNGHPLLHVNICLSGKKFKGSRRPFKKAFLEAMKTFFGRSGAAEYTWWVAGH